MKNLLDNLRAFNSKERFFLVGEVLGNPQFTLAAEFRERLSAKLKLSIPADAFSAMDYHIDWIYASLRLARDGEPINTVKKYNINRSIIKAQQEDVDWLVAYRDKSDHHIILIEAKGVTSWSNDQMRSKVDRFKAIFAEDPWPGVIFHFVLMSPKPSVRLDHGLWFPWKPVWLSLRVPKKWRVSRCNEEKKEDRNGKYWKTAPRKSGEEE